LRRADNLKAAPLKYVDNARDQRRFWANHRKIDAMRFGELSVTFDVGGGRHAVADAWIAG
jgi:hypothetical protein